MKDIEIRVATEEDLDGLIAIGDELFDNPVKPDRAREFLKDPRHHLIIALKGENIVGMTSAFHYVHPDKDPELFINEAGVIEEYQNKGIGRRLVRKMVEHGKTLGCNEAWVGTEMSNLAARKAYKAAGGKEDEEPFILIEFDQ